MYQALYRKWRPRGWDDVSGQEHITLTLKRQIETDRLSHAYLFVGTRGTGKTTCAKILARAVNCEKPVDGSPCNVCPACTGIENGSILDVLELDAASNNGVDNVRALREEAVYTPASAKKRVYIVDEVHMLTPAAFNALLKILEEPPEHLMFILATTELHKVPATILSRCQRFSFKRLTPDIIAKRLIHVSAAEGLTLTQDAAEKLSRLADGSMRDALSLLDQCASDTLIDLDRVLDSVGLSGNDELLRLAGAVAGGETLYALTTLDSLYTDGRDMSGLLNELSSLFRDVLVNQLSPGSSLLTGNFDQDALSALSKNTSAEKLIFCLETIKESALGLTRGSNARQAVETCLIRISCEKLSDSKTALLARIEKLESGAVLASITGSPAQDGMVSVQTDLKPDESSTLPAPSAPAASPIPQTEDIKDTAKMPRSDTEKKEKTAQTRDYWNDILELLRGDIPVYSLLSDKTQIFPELSGNVLTVRSANPFMVSSLESKTIIEPLRKAAEKALGGAVTVKIEQSAVMPEDTQKKLERLSAFDIIKFEE